MPKAYTPDQRAKMVAHVLERLADGESLRTICRSEDVPNRRTIYEWAESDEALASAIARARDIGFDELAERTLEEAETDGDAALGMLKFRARTWYLAKLNPKRYGERTQVATTDVEGNDKASEEDIYARLAAIVAIGQKRLDNGEDLA